MAGTLTHEGGHYLAGKVRDVPITVHFASCSYDQSYHDRIAEWGKVYDKNRSAIQAGAWFPAKEAYDAATDRYHWDRVVVTAGGPLQTMITGTAGLLFLWRNKRVFRRSSALSAGQWLIILFTFFWSRQLLNFLAGLLTVLGGQNTYGDEVALSHYFRLPPPAIPAITAFVALGVILYTIAQIPGRQRLTFIAAGLAGSALGFYLWMEVAGPVILP